MKKLLSLCLVALVLLTAVPALAAGDDYKYLQPHTSVDLTVFKDAGYTLTYNEVLFSATLTAPTVISCIDMIDIHTIDTYTFSFELVMHWDGRVCTWLPRLVMTASGPRTYECSPLDKVYFKAGENRYVIDVQSVERSIFPTSGEAEERVAEPLGPDGTDMLHYLAEYAGSLKASFDDRGTFILFADDQDAIRAFLDACEKAGVFSQPHFRSYDDNFSVLTLFNKD